ncbi:MAG: TldD/PmbA family protein [Firmicutes bacterium]|jgi:TldD protein|nr:TldD/PmbA family protein [Bacillota bacterium]MDH7496676.1 TldD/PmbA family protein [Bacillota bacterium]
MLDLLKSVATEAQGYVEIRYHRRLQTAVDARNGALRRVERRTLAGAGVRCLVDGSWGFVSTTDVTLEGLRRAVTEASDAARAGARLRREKARLSAARLASGEFACQTFDDEPDIAEKMKVVLGAERRMRDASPLVVGSMVIYTEYADEKYIVTSDGAQAHIVDRKPSFHVFATVRRGDAHETGAKAWGVTGGWHDLLRKRDLDKMVDEAVDLAVRKLDAGYAKGGSYTVILDPQLVGVLSHEAIGHTVEADFVQSGSVVKDKIGEKVASDLVTLVDDGTMSGAAGMVLVDDEGVLGERTVIIDKGVLRNYLHSRESAAAFGAAPHGNARAFTYRDEPIIRMTNTFILPGTASLEDMIAGIDDGFFLKEMGQGGQADSTAEFMFGVSEAYRIKHGKIAELVKGVTISGQAFDVLKSVDAVSGDFELALGSGHCGKWQLAKVDAGGPYLRCRVTIGGRHD